MSRIAASVAIVATDGAGGRAGATVNTLSPVSADQPPSLLICLQRTTSVCKAIRANGTFSINSLSQEQLEIARVFAGSAAPKKNDGGKNDGANDGRNDGANDGDSESKFQHGDWQKNENDVWLLQGALASFDCELKQTLVWQSHEVIIGEVRSIRLDAGAAPLLYANRSYTMLAEL